MANKSKECRSFGKCGLNEYWKKCFSVIISTYNYVQRHFSHETWHTLYFIKLASVTNLTFFETSVQIETLVRRAYVYCVMLVSTNIFLQSEES